MASQAFEGGRKRNSSRTGVPVGVGLEVAVGILVSVPVAVLVAVGVLLMTEITPDMPTPPGPP